MYSFTSDAQNIYLLKTIPECKKSTSSPTFFVLHYKQLITYINKYRYYRMFYSHVKKAPAYSPGYPAPISGYNFRYPAENLTYYINKDEVSGRLFV